MLTAFRKLLSLLEPRERLQLFALFALMLFAAVIQTVGVASVLPFMRVASDPATIGQDEWLNRIYQWGRFESPRTFLIFMGGGVLGFIALSNSVGALEHYLLSRFVWRKQHLISVRLLNKYLRAPYTFFLQENTAGLAKNILSEVGEVVSGVLMPCLNLLAQSLIVIAILLLLVLVEPSIALSAGVMLGGGYGLIYTLTRGRQRRLGEVRRASNHFRFKAASEALGSIKETKVLAREAEFLKRFASANRRFANANAANTINRDIPRYTLETLAFGGIIVIVMYLIGTRDEFGDVVAVMSLYALAAYRLLPALRHVFRGLSQIRFNTPALESLHRDLTSQLTPVQPVESGPPPAPLSFARRIALRAVSYRYPNTDLDVLRDITLDIPKNSSVAFVGSTGSGKTTLVDILLGLLEPRDGSIFVDDVRLLPADLRAWRMNLGYVPQHIYLCDDTVARNIALGVPDAEIDHAAVERAARVAHLHDFIRSLPEGYGTVVGERGVRLSGGQRQRIGIARALYRDPEVLIMDEATSALDGVTEEAVIQAIRELSTRKTIIIVAHRLTTVRECDAIYLFENGEIATQGSYQELLSTNLTFRAMASGSVEGLAVR